LYRIANQTILNQSTEPKMFLLIFVRFEVEITILHTLKLDIVNTERVELEKQRPSL